MPRTLTSRLARCLVGSVVAALAVVVAGVSVTVSTFLERRTDQLLLGLAERGVRGLGDARAAAIDYAEAEAELDDIRPSGVRIELRGLEDDLRIGLGPTFDLSRAGDGCETRGSLRVCARRRGDVAIVAARDRTDELAARDELLLVLGGAALLATMAVAALSRTLARRTARPLAELAARVDALEPGTGGRVGRSSDVAEVDLVAARFDDLVARFEEAMAREKRFASQASHELRTPLTVARAEIEALAEGRSEPGLAGRALAALDRLDVLIAALLWFARAQARLDEDGGPVVNLADLVRAELDAVERDHPERPLAVDLPDEALVRGDEPLLGRAIANLVDNAVRHGAGGEIAARLTVVDHEVVLRLGNDGPSIPASLREHIFEPFVRAAYGRTPGFGLGLPFARAVARAHGGDVALGDHWSGTEVVLRLPLAAAV